MHLARQGAALLVVVSVGLAATEVGAAPRTEASDRAEQARLLARTLTQEASAAFERRDFSKAQQFLESAYLLFASDKIQYSLARVYEAQKNPLLAMRAYQQFLRKVSTSERLPGQTEDASGAVRRLSERLGHIVLIGNSAVVMQVDDEPPRRYPGGDVWVEPGNHRVLFADALEQVTIAAGETVTLRPSSEAVARNSSLLAGMPGASASSKLAPAKWGVGISGLLVLVTGATLWALDGRPTCMLSAGQQRCPSQLNGQPWGIGLVSTGGAMLVASGVLFGLDARASSAQASTVAAKNPSLLGLALEF